jgi:hypothetical protein
MTGTLAVSALFFSVDSSSKSKDSDPACTSNGFWQFLVKNIVIGIISAFLSTVPLIFISMLQRRRIITRRDWTEERKMAYLRWWKWADVVFKSFLASYVLACFLFISIFLANTTFQTGLDFLVSVIFTIVRDLLLVPVALSLCVAALVTILNCSKPEMIRTVMGRWHILLPDEKKPEDDDSESEEEQKLSPVVPVHRPDENSKATTDSQQAKYTSQQDQQNILNVLSPAFSSFPASRHYMWEHDAVLPGAAPDPDRDDGRNSGATGEPQSAGASCSPPQSSPASSSSDFRGKWFSAD